MAARHTGGEVVEGSGKAVEPRGRPKAAGDRGKVVEPSIERWTIRTRQARDGETLAPMVGQDLGSGPQDIRAAGRQAFVT
jgi:hypothetical protein